MTDILTLALSVLPYIVLVAFPLILVSVLDSTGAPAAIPSELEPLPTRGEIALAPVLAGRPVSARA